MSRPQEEKKQEPEKRPRRHRLRKVLGILFLLLLAGLAWLNGPGWRWLGGIGLRKALANADMQADFELKGTLLGGIRVEKLLLSGGIIRKLEIGSAVPIYDFHRLLRKELDGISVNHIEAVIDLAAAPPEDPAKPEEPFDPKKLAETLRTVRSFLIPMELRAADLRFQLARGEENLLTLDSSDFTHAPGSDEFRLKLGTLAAGAGYAFSEQETVIEWTEERLTLDRFGLTPDLGLRDLQVELPASGALSASGSVLVEDSRLVLGGTPGSATLKLEGEPLAVHEAAKNFALALPMEVTLRSLDVSISGFDKSPDQWTAALSAEAGDAVYEDWRAESLKLDGTLQESGAELRWNLAALDTTASGEAAVAWRNLAAGDWMDFSATAALEAPRLSPLFAALKEKFEFAPAEAPPLPASSLTLDATADSGPEGIRSAEARWLISPEKDAPALAGENRWTPDGKLSGSLGTDGLRASYTVDLQAKRYEGNASLDGFRPEKLSPWAAAAGTTLPGGMNATGTWKGSGDFAAQPHRGSFDISSFEWVRADTPPLLLRTRGSYDWPREVELASLTATAEGQTIEAEAVLRDELLEIARIEWKDGETRLVGGRAEIPVPANPGDLNAFLRQTEPISVFLESEWIDNSRLAAWLPEKKSPLAAGSGRVHLVIAGTPAAPKIDLEAHLKGLALPDQPDVPVTDATLELDGAEDGLVLAGEIRPASYPPVTLSGKIPFKPGEWAENPGAVLEEPLEARANIPRLELATFKEMLPKTRTLDGAVEGFFSAGGTVGSPELSGELRLAGGAFEMEDSPVPPVTNASALLALQGQEVRLETLSLEIAGGSVSGSGKAGLEEAANPALDFSLKGNALPLKRDESMIVRADANLDLRGTLLQASVSGTVDIVDSLYYRDFEILPVRVPFTAPSRPKLPAIDPDEKAADLPEPFRDWTLDVRVRTRDPLLIRGNLADGSAIADVRFGGTLGNILPQGKAIISDATARLPFSTLEVDNGAVLFTPAGGLNPELNIRGRSTIGRYEVNVFFYGPVNAPKTALTSDPPLPESEIMTLLATGTTSEGLEGGQAATLKAAQLLVEEWRKGRLPFAEQVAEVMEVLNRVDVRIGEDDPLTGKRLNSATIELHDRWYISGSVDKQSNTRVLGAFVIRFK